MSEVVFFVGPPFGGKTLYYQQHLESSHERVSASELYWANPEWGLRKIVLHIVDLLRRGKNVVVDDENWSRKTRMSYIQNIGVKVSSCKFICYIFSCNDAFECFWRREWVLAKHVSESQNKAQLSMSVDLHKTGSRIQKWFQHQSGDQVSGIDAVKDIEGWHQVKSIKTTLTVESNNKFEVPGLFLEWSAINHTSTSKLTEALKVWTYHNPCGRLFVLATREDEVTSKDDDSNHSTADETYAALLQNISDTTQILSKNIETPIYYFIIKDPCQSGSFTKPPEPGILPFLQHLHHLNLHHAGTVYLHQSNTRHPTDLSQSGLNQFAISTVCKNPWLLAMCQGGHTSGPVHPAVKDVQFVAASESCMPQVPMYDEIEFSEDEAGTYTMEDHWGRVLGVSYKDKHNFEKYQQEYTDNASHITVTGTKMEMKLYEQSLGRSKSSSSDHGCIQSTDGYPVGTSNCASSEMGRRDLPAWLKPKKSMGGDGKGKEDDARRNFDNFLGSVSPDKSKDSSKKTAGDKSLNLPKTIYCMTVAELREVAKLFLNGDDDGDSQTDVASEMPLPNSEWQKVDQDGNRKKEEINNGTDEEMEKEKMEEQDEEEEASREDNQEEKLKGKDSKPQDDVDKDDGVASIITDLLTGDGGCRKPPPRKKRILYPRIDSAPIWSDEDESVHSAPFQIYNSPNQHHSNRNCEQDKTKKTIHHDAKQDTSDEDHIPESVKRKLNKPVPDLSFLDDVF